MNMVFAAMLMYAVAGASTAATAPAPNAEVVAQVLAGEQKTAYASWWGFDPNDATAALQAAIDSGAKKVIVENMKTPWVLRPIRLAGDQELVLEKGVVLRAKRGEFRGPSDSLLSASGKRNIRITGPGATLRMWRDDYDRPPYTKAEWRHALNIRSCTGVYITGLALLESGGDGIYLGVSQKDVTNTDVEIRDVVCDKNYRQGISVISAKNLLIENTILRATSGTAPTAGIDFEPNHSSELLVNCVMRDCLVEGNTGDGFLFALHNLTHESAPISVRLENCRSVGNRNAFRLNTGNSAPRTCVPGSIEAIDCRFQGSEQAGIAVSNKPAEGCRVQFERCNIVNAAQNQPKAAPILFSTSADSVLNVGAVEFADVTLIDSVERCPVGYSDRAGGLKLTGLGGTLTVERQGQRTAYRLDQKTLDTWFPFQAFRQFPPFDMATLRWESTPPQPRQRWNCAVRQRGHAEFILWAQAGQEVAFALGLKRVGKSGTPEMSVAVVTPSGERSSLPKMAGEGERSYTFQAEQAGPYRLVCEPGNSTVQVVSCNLPIGLYSERAPFHLLGTAGDVYFCVPAGVQEFAIRVSGGGEGESVKAVVYDAVGAKNLSPVRAEKDNIDGHQFLFRRSATADTEIWRLQLVKPSQGVIEDYYVQLQGIPPLLATRPEALPRPAMGPPRTSEPLPRLQVSENRRFLVTEDSRPFFWLGDTAWFLLRLTNDEIRYYLSNRVRKGFTGIQVDLNPYAWTNLMRAGEMENPFLNNNPDTPNETYWQRVDWMVDEAGRSGLYVLLTPMWGKHYPRYVGNDTDKARRLGRWLGRRYRDRTHVLWFASGEYDSINGYRAITPAQKAILNAVAQGLEEGHGGAQLMTIHPGARRTSAADFHGEAWLDFNMLQSGHFDEVKATGHTENYLLVAHDYDRTPTKPVFDGEPAYEDMIDGYFAGPKDGSSTRMHADVMRRKAYWAVFAGGFGHTYGHTDVQIFWSEGKPRETANRNHWRDALEAPGAGQMRHLRTLIESRPFLNRLPDQSVIVSANGSGKDHAQATRASDGSYALVYLPTGQAVTVDMSKIAGAKAKASWFDPREGKTTEIGGFPASGTRAFVPPSRGADNDWVLVLDAADPGNGWGEQTIPLGAGAADRVDYFPPPDAQDGWRRLKDAEEIRRVAGIDIRKLDEAFDVAAASTKNGGVLVVRHGWLVYERYFGRGHREATPNLASCGKSFTSVAVGILMAEHPELFPEGLDQKVFTPEYLPPEAFPLSDPAMAEIKLGQLLAFSAGIRGNNPCYVNGKEATIDPPGPDGWPSIVDEIALGKRDHVSNGQRYSAAALWCAPGGGYSYATASIHIVSMIVRRVAGMELQDYLQKHLAEPMGWGRWGYAYKYAKEVTHTPGGGGITLRATDMLRFGYLLLHEGRWGGRQLVPAPYVRQCARQSPYNPHYAYSLQFNVNSDGHVPEYPRDAFWKSGSGAHMLYVVPSLDLVVWKLAGRDSQYEQRDTGAPLAPEIAQGSEWRRNWKPTINEREGQRLVLSKVIEAIVAPGSP